MSCLGAGLNVSSLLSAVYHFQVQGAVLWPVISTPNVHKVMAEVMVFRHKEKNLIIQYRRLPHSRKHCKTSLWLPRFRHVESLHPRLVNKSQEIRPSSKPFKIFSKGYVLRGRIPSGSAKHNPLQLVRILLRIYRWEKSQWLRCKINTSWCGFVLRTHCKKPAVNPSSVNVLFSIHRLPWT